MQTRAPVLAATLLVLLGSIFAVAPAVAQHDDADQSTVTVTGEGTVTTPPDQAVVRFGVVTQEPTAEEARTRNATAAKNAMNAVRALDVPDEKMRMESLRIRPEYEYNDEENKRELIGYEATRKVVVEVARLEVLPQLVADVVQGGANRLDEIDYQLSDRSQFRNEALRKAAQTAQEKAQLLAETLEASLGPVHTVREQNFSYGQSQPRLSRTGMAQTASSQAEPEAYAAGEMEVSATVQVVFKLGTARDQ